MTRARAAASTADKWVWRPRRTEGRANSVRPLRRQQQQQHREIRKRRQKVAVPSSSPPRFARFAVTALMLMMMSAIQNVQALGFFELQILEIENYRGQLATGECCGGGGGVQAANDRFNAPLSLQCAAAPQCNTLFRVCLREYQSRQPQQQQQPRSAQAAGGGVRTGGAEDDGGGTANAAPPNHPQFLYPSGSNLLHHCSFGNVTSPVLGGNSFTLGSDAATAPDPVSPSSSDAAGGNRGAAGGNLALPFSFSWTRSFTFILQAMDYNNSTDTMSVIEEATYSGILLPGNEWKALSHLGHTARMAYRVRVRCDRNYYGQTCTKLCKPRDDRFGHYTCGDTDGRKECIPGWQGETCDKAVCKTGCHHVHGKCDYPGGCECRKGWQGELCDQCMTYPGCKHGYCNGTSWQCICDVNWGGILCDQDLNYCGTHEPCLNGGTCKSTAPDRYTCTCPEGFGGANCDVVLNPCATEPCANGGKCRTVDAVPSLNGTAAAAATLQGPAVQQPPPFQVPKQFHCDCRPGWTGSTCNTEIDECATQPPRCSNGGTCVDLVADWRCACLDDRWRGRRCEIDVDECERQHRERQSAAADLQCGPNAVPCKTTAVVAGIPGTASECVCRRGWTTAAAAARDNGSLVAAALAGCTVNVDDCAGPELKCANGGTCLDLIGGYACACPVGFTGRNCRTQIDPCGYVGESEQPTSGAANPCKNGGECVPAKRWRNGASGGSVAKPLLPYSCICPLGYSGENCEIDRDHCTPNPCRNGGECLNTPDDYYCQCSGNGWSWHGKNCTVPYDTGGAVNNAVKTTVATTMTAVVGPTLPASPIVPHAESSSTTEARQLAPGTTEWQRGSNENNSKTIAVTIVEQQPADDDDDGDGGAQAICGNNVRRQRVNKHWPADDGCNECKCVVKPTVSASCTNLWCGPAAYDCLNGITPCAGIDQVCQPILDDADNGDPRLDETSEKREEDAAGSLQQQLMLWRQCLRPPCADADRDDSRLRYGLDDDEDDDEAAAYVAADPWQRRRRRGQCVTKMTDDDDDDDDDPPMTVWPSAVRHCLPNGVAAAGDGKGFAPRGRHPRGGRPANRACGRLRVTLDPNRLRRGTRVSGVCHSLRRLLARAWTRDDERGTPDRWNRLYVMCEADRPMIDVTTTAADRAATRGRRRRRVAVRVSIAVAVDHQQQRRATAAAAADEDLAETVVSRAVETLYNRLNGVVPAASQAKKANGYRVRPATPSAAADNGAGEEYDDDDDDAAAALAFSTAAVVDVVVSFGIGATVEQQQPSPPAAPSNSSGTPSDDYQKYYYYYYYYWTGGVACGALATVLAVTAFLLLRFRGGAGRKIGNGGDAASVAESLAANGIGGDGLMLSLVRRQNEENLKRHLQVTGGVHRLSAASAGGDYGAGCGRNNNNNNNNNNLSAGSSLSCSRVSVVHPLCNAAGPNNNDDDDDGSPRGKRKPDADGAAAADEKRSEKTTNSTPAAAAAVRSVAVAVAVPQQQQPRPAPVVAIASPPVLRLCKKTLNVDSDQLLLQQRRQQIAAAQQYDLLHRHAAAPLVRAAVVPSAAGSGNNHNNNNNGRRDNNDSENGGADDASALTVLV